MSDIPIENDPIKSESPIQNSVKLQIAKEVAKSAFERFSYLNIVFHPRLILPWMKLDGVPELLQKIKSTLLMDWKDGMGLIMNRIDVFGPLMSVFTLAIVLVLGIRMDEKNVHEGTILGVALSLSFAYWILSSLVFYGICLFVDAAISLVQIIILAGYGILPAVLITFFSNLTELLVSYPYFFFWFLTIGISSSLSFGRTIYLHTHNKKRRLGLILISIAHLLLLLCLRWTYQIRYLLR